MIGSVSGNTTTYTTTLTYTKPAMINVIDVISTGVAGGSDGFVLGDGTKTPDPSIYWQRQMQDMQELIIQIMKTQDDTNTTIIGNLRI